MAAQVADIANFNGQVVSRLPLDVQRVVHGVRQLVGAVVHAERDRLAAVHDAARGGQKTRQIRSFGIGRRSKQ